MNFSKEFLIECREVIGKIDYNEIEKMASILKKTRDKGGRLFILGSGGGAGHASHAVCDFRRYTNALPHVWRRLSRDTVTRGSTYP